MRGEERAERGKGELRQIQFGEPRNGSSSFLAFFLLLGSIYRALSFTLSEARALSLRLMGWMSEENIFSVFVLSEEDERRESGNNVVAEEKNSTRRTRRK